MNVNDRPAASRQFVAQPPFWGSKVASKTTPAWQNNFGKSYAIMVAGVVAFSVVLGGLYVGMQSLGAEWMELFRGRAFQLVLIVLLFGGVYAWYWWSRRKTIIVSVTTDGLTVNTRPGEVYSFSDAKLGTWGVTGGATMGTALHLQCGQHRFILGGRDRRVASGTRLEAPDAGYGSRWTSTLGCRPQISARFSPWSVAGVGWMYDRPHRGSPLAACCLPTRC